MGEENEWIRIVRFLSLFLIILTVYMYHLPKTSKWRWRGGEVTRISKRELVRNNVRRCVRENFIIFLKDTENGKSWGVWHAVCNNGHNQSSHPSLNTLCKVTLPLLPVPSGGCFSTFWLWTRSFACFGWQGNSNCDTSKGHEAPAGWGLPSQLPGSPPQPHEPLQKRDHRLTPAIPTAQGETPVCGQSHPRPSRPGQAFQTTRTTHSQSAEVQGITCCLKSLSLQKTMKSTKGHLRWIFKIILQRRRTSNTEQKSWREKNFSSPKITHTYLAWQKPLSIRLNKQNKWQDRKNMWLLSQTKVGSPTLWRVTMNQ